MKTPMKHLFNLFNRNQSTQATIKEVVKKNPKEFALTQDLIERFESVIDDFKESEAIEKFNERVNSVENVEIYFKSDASIKRFRKTIRKDYSKQIQLALAYLEQRLGSVYAERYNEEQERLMAMDETQLKALKESSTLAASLKRENEEYFIQSINNNKPEDQEK